MPERLKLESIQFKLGSQPQGSRPRPAPETPFKMLVMGDFQGAGSNSLPAGKPMPVDLDNFDQVMTRLDVRLGLPPYGSEAPAISLSFHSLDDFHPDHIMSKLDWFNRARELKSQLQNPSTFGAAAAQVQGLIGTAPESTPSPASASPAPSPEPASAESTEGMMERLLGKPTHGEHSPRTPSNPVDQLLRQAVQGSIVPEAHPSRDVYVQAVNTAMTGRLNAILHHPDFQRLEAAWRGLDFLVKNIELEENLRLYILQAPQESLIQDFARGEDLSDSHFYQAVVQPAVHMAGGQPWSVWMGNYSFGIGEQDAGLLAALAKLGGAAGTPFLGAINTEVIERWTGRDIPSEDELKHWTALRKFPDSVQLGLAWPRFLLRLPYGAKSDPVDSFPFEEIPGRPDPRHYLWGNPALALTCLLGQSFSQYEWDLGDNLLHELEGLPLHVYKEDGESKMTPCAEVWLNDQNSDTLLENGLTPLQSVQRRDTIRIPRFQSIHSPATALGRQWS